LASRLRGRLEQKFVPGLCCPESRPQSWVYTPGKWILSRSPNSGVLSRDLGSTGLRNFLPGPRPARLDSGGRPPTNSQENVEFVSKFCILGRVEYSGFVPGGRSIDALIAIRASIRAIARKEASYCIVLRLQPPSAKFVLSS
jgi:hypothetical protein